MDAQTGRFGTGEANSGRLAAVDPLGEVEGYRATRSRRADRDASEISGELPGRRAARESAGTDSALTASRDEANRSAPSAADSSANVLADQARPARSLGTRSSSRRGQRRCAAPLEMPTGPMPGIGPRPT
ncbi:hypothetical protein NKG94_25600 [Micromonospora sp. M12]